MDTLMLLKIAPGRRKYLDSNSWGIHFCVWGGKGVRVSDIGLEDGRACNVTKTETL